MATLAQDLNYVCEACDSVVPLGVVCAQCTELEAQFEAQWHTSARTAYGVFERVQVGVVDHVPSATDAPPHVFVRLARWAIRGTSDYVDGARAAVVAVSAIGLVVALSWIAAYALLWLIAVCCELRG